MSFYAAKDCFNFKARYPLFKQQFKIWIVLVLGSFLLTAVPAMAQSKFRLMENNKKIIQEGFNKWANGTGNFFDLLAEDVQWTITGTSPLSKTYTSKQQFMEEVIIPLNERLSQKIVPKVRRLYADGDAVVALWDGQATAKDGQPYNVTYSWHMRLQQGRIVEVIAFLDTLEFAAIFNRIPSDK